MASLNINFSCLIISAKRRVLLNKCLMSHMIRRHKDDLTRNSIWSLQKDVSPYFSTWGVLIPSAMNFFRNPCYYELIATIAAILLLPWQELPNLEGISNQAQRGQYPVSLLPSNISVMMSWSQTTGSFPKESWNQKMTCHNESQISCRSKPGSTEWFACLAACL